jgi:pimeloyl-ACP methyl ester carboxylesterase
VPINVTSVLEDWVKSTDLEPYRKLGGRAVIELALSGIAGYTPSDEIREDYPSSYAGDRFADTVPYVQRYLDQLPELAELPGSIATPVRIVQGSDDQVVPAANSEFLHDRLPHSRVDFIKGAGHFCWEERPDEYAALVTDWWHTGYASV